jgi:hypothetical protein
VPHSRSHTTLHFMSLHMRGEWLWWNTNGMEWTHVFITTSFF